MRADALIIAAVALVASIAGTGLVRRRALARGALDIPNERSSHSAPTPRGGGAAIVLTTLVALAVLAARRVVSPDVAIALVGGGIAVAIVGYLDDRTQLSARVRLTVHFLAALWALFWLGGMPPLQIGAHTVDFGWVGYPFGALAIVWTLNLFNFMDGIDGIAASEAAFVCGASALLLPLDVGVSSAALSLAAASAGFLIWNWPPARIFMGDIGSGYVGYFIAVLAISSARTLPTAPLVWLILGGVFFVDASVTLLRRLTRGEAPHVAHRSHAYQSLARRWGSHRPVTVVAVALNLFWLLPAACVAVSHPQLAGWLTLAALLPMALAALLVGAGRREPPAPGS